MRKINSNDRNKISIIYKYYKLYIILLLKNITESKENKKISYKVENDEYSSLSKVQNEYMDMKEIKNQSKYNVESMAVSEVIEYLKEQLINNSTDAEIFSNQYITYIKYVRIKYIMSQIYNIRDLSIKSS